jgi:tetratricopeptide (TPR) repeat protein
VTAVGRLGAPLGATLLVAAGVRFLYGAALAEHPALLEPVLDAAANVEWARGLAAGSWPGAEPFFRPPGYVVALAALLRVAGGDPARVAAIQLLLGTATPLLACLLAGRLAGRAAAWIAGLGAAVYPTLLFFDGQLLAPFLAVPVFAGAMLAGAAAREREGALTATVAGLLFGVAGTAWPLVLPAGAWLVLSLARRGRRRAAALAACGLLAAPLAATAHNVAAGDPAFLATQGGLNLYLGNARGADGMTATFAEAPRALGYRMIEAAAQAAEAREGRALRASEVSAHYVRRTLEGIASDPGGWLVLLGRKALLALGRREIPNNQDLALVREEIPLLGGPGWGFWLPLAFVGAWRSRREPAARWVASGIVVVLAGCVAFFVTDRFRVPAAPLVVALGAAGLAGIARDARRRRWRALAAGAAAAVGLGLAARANPLRLPERPWPMSYVLMADAEHARGEPVRALRWAERALAEQPDLYPAALARVELLRGAGRVEKAREETERALRKFPGDAALLHERAILLDLAGDAPAALAEVDRAIAADPSLEPARISRAVILVRLGRANEAAAALEAFLARRPSQAQASRARELLAEIARGGAPATSELPDAAPGPLSPGPPVR